MDSILSNIVLTFGLVGLLASMTVIAVLLRGKKRVSSWTVWVASMCLFLFMGLSVTGIVMRGRLTPDPLRPEIADSAEVRARLVRGGRLIGSYLAEGHQGGRIGVIISPESERGAGEEAMLRALLQAAAPCDTRTVELDRDRDGDGVWYSARLFDEALGDCSDCSVIVSLAGLPEVLADLRFWWGDAPPPLIVANAQVLLLRRLIQEGRVEAVLVRRPWHPGEAVPGEKDEWLLVTTANIAEIVKQYPSLFAQ